ncbi:hypothetical protein [Marisediminicola sp. LYQ134]|uniref:hypothetical protein n=1 Tax=Marisediminicola sp. LYQ134 TaxID=3391061 RepID=UPI00398392BC
MSGVPIDQVTARDFIMVRAELVRTVGGANNALVWTRIEYRCAPNNDGIYTDPDGTLWWPVSRDELAVETGLTSDQVRRSLEHLVDAGFLASTEHRRGGNYDRTKSYRPIIEGRPVDRANTPDGAAQSTGHIRPIERAKTPNVPYLQTVSTDVETSLVRTSGPDASTQIITDAQRLCDALVEWMIRNGNRRPTIGKRWHDAARRLLTVDGISFDEALRVLTWSQQDEFWQANIHSLPKFREQFDKLRARADRSGTPATQPLTNAQKAIALANSIPEGDTRGPQTDRAIAGPSL